MANKTLSSAFLNGSSSAVRRPETAVFLPPPPAQSVVRKFEAPAELWKLLDLYVDFVLEQNGYAVTAQTREGMFPLIISDRLRTSIAQDKFFKTHLEKQYSSAADVDKQEEPQQ